MTTFDLSFQQALVEEVVLRAIAGHPEEHQFRRQRNKLYLLPEEQRDAAFGELHAQWFRQLGLGRAIDIALAELPLLAHGCARGIVTGAASHRDEGADLLVAPDAAGPAGRTLLIRVCASTFQDPERLLGLLRSELLHVADMVDPAFGYQPTLPPSDGGPSYECLVRERYRALWDVSVAGRLIRRGVADAEVEACAAASFRAAFPMLGEVAERTFRHFLSGAAHTHADLVGFALAPRGALAAERLVPGGRCPLCRFPTFAPEPVPETLPQAIVERVVSDFPTWRPNQGLCRQCADLYRARPLSMSGAMTLPGYTTM